MKKFHFQIKIISKSAQNLLIDKQAELAKAWNGDKKNQPTMPYVINHILNEISKK